MSPTRKTIAGVTGATALIMGGVDLAVLDVAPIERTEVVGEERIISKQVGNVVETELPWKSESGIKVKYDMGVASAEERVRDKRNKQVITELVDFGDGGFKVDVILDKKPKSNLFCYEIEGHENYDLFYQPEITDAEAEASRFTGVDVNGNPDTRTLEEIKRSIRPENMVGSYAVYHKTLKNNQYETGKVMHIPRPMVWEVDDKEGTTEWATLSFNEDTGNLCVTVDDDYLQKATYPVRVDPTFGYTSVGASSQTFYSEGSTESPSYYTASQFTLTEDGTVNETNAYISSGGFYNPTFGWQSKVWWGYLLYEDGVDDRPDGYIAKTSTTTQDQVDYSDVVQWWDLPMPDTVLTAGDYWITPAPAGADGNFYGGNAKIYYDSGSGDSDVIQSGFPGDDRSAYLNYASPLDPFDDLPLDDADEGAGTKQYSIYATYDTPLNYETGQETISDSLVWTSISFENTYTEPPVIFSTPVTAANCEANGGCTGNNTNGGEPPIPTVRNVTTTGFDISMCIDDGLTTCSTSKLAETVDWFAFEAGTTDDFSWIEVGTSTVSTNGSDTSITLKNAMVNTPAVWTQAQTYSQGGNIAAHAWTEDTATMSNTAIILIGCTHQGTGDGCDGSTPAETFGYLAIDLANEAFPVESGFQTGSDDITQSSWSTGSFSPAYTSPRVMVTQNDDDGGQDPEYAWARAVTTTGFEFRYCESDGGDVCNSHTSEVVVWFALEQTSVTPPETGGQTTQSIIWFN
jgi:hypothetical protein